MPKRRLVQPHGLYGPALECYRKALAVEPAFALAHYNEARILLLQGDFAPGWAKYEWRWQVEGFAKVPPRFPQPRWQGQDLGAGTLLLHAEQGLGDTLQFCRYIPLAAARARILLSVPPPLIRLLRSLPGIAAFLRPGEPVPPFEHYCPLLSLPFVFQTRMATIPAIRGSSFRLPAFTLEP